MLAARAVATVVLVTAGIVFVIWLVAFAVGGGS